VKFSPYCYRYSAAMSAMVAGIFSIGPPEIGFVGELLCL